MRTPATIAVVVALSACTGPSPASERRDVLADIPAHSELPAAQRVVLADGVVTRTEYEAAYDAFVACVAESGGLLEEQRRDERSGMIWYRVGNRLGTPTRPDLGSVEGRCYHDTFDSVEYVFHAQQQEAAGGELIGG